MKTTDTQIVLKIIDDALAEGDSTSKFYVLEQIKNCIHPTRLFNKVLSAGCVTEDGVENMRRGAARIYQDSIRRIKADYVVTADGVISKKGIK